MSARTGGGLALWPLREGLRRRLLGLDYEGFARACALLLEATGYEDARLTGRREWKGYNRPGGGGWDLEATLPGGVAPRRVIAQAKQFDALPVHQRQVDELRGACLRAGASEAVLITSSSFSQSVRRHSAAIATVPLLGPARLIAPVRLIDGEELTALMVLHRLGVKEVRSGGGRRLVIDGDFFHGLSDGAETPELPDLPSPATKPVVRQTKVRLPPVGTRPIGKLPEIGKPAEGRPDVTSTVEVGVSGVPGPRRWLVTVRVLRGRRGRGERPGAGKGQP